MGIQEVVAQGHVCQIGHAPQIADMRAKAAKGQRRLVGRGVANRQHAPRIGLMRMIRATFLKSLTCRLRNRIVDKDMVQISYAQLSALQEIQGIHTFI